MLRRRDLAIVIGVAAIVQFTYFFLRFGSFYYPDSFTYLDPARNFLHGLGFVNGKPLEPETIRTPGYPLLLVLFGARTVPVIILQHLMRVALAVSVYLFMWKRHPRNIALVAAILFAIDTPSILAANKLLSETLFTSILFTIFVLALQERPRPLLIALLLGFLVLVRPIAMFFFPLVALRIPRRKLALFLVAALALPIGCAFRNWRQTGVFTVASIGSINTLGQHAAGVLAIEDEGNFRANLLDEQRGLAEDADDFIQEKLKIPDAQELPTAVRAKYYGQYARSIIVEHPVALIELTARGLLVNLFESDWEAMEPVTLLRPSTLRLTLGVMPVIVFVFAVIGVIALWRLDRKLSLSILFTTGYFLMISAGGEAEARFRVPVAPQLAMAAAVGLGAVRRAFLNCGTHESPGPVG